MNVPSGRRQFLIEPLSGPPCAERPGAANAIEKIWAVDFILTGSGHEGSVMKRLRARGDPNPKHRPARRSSCRRGGLSLPVRVTLRWTCFVSPHAVLTVSVYIKPLQISMPPKVVRRSNPLLHGCARGN